MKKFEGRINEFNFRIEEDYPEVGVYLYIFKDGKCIRDELQNTIEICKNVALEMYGMPIDGWHEIQE